MAKVLIVVDYQNDFVDGSLGFTGAEKLDDGIAAKLEEYTGKGKFAICTMDSHYDFDYLNTQEGRKLPIKHCIRGTEGWELYGKTEKAAKMVSAITVGKETFPGRKLIEVLRRIDASERYLSGVGITDIEICGVVTNICVISNAVIAKAALPEANIKILKNLCGSNDPDTANKAFDVMASLQMEIVE